jgi:beta-galactosidase/beta-glucuronidase
MKAALDPVRGYPRPMLERDEWTSLNGDWDFSFDFTGALVTPDEVRWTHRIRVPFSPETSASGVGHRGFIPACWYRRRFVAPVRDPNARLLLHFGAVDYRARVWVDGHYAGGHSGGYTPWSLDITEFVGSEPEHGLTVRVDDDPQDLTKPRGKQDWQLEPHSIWYPRTTGIWQTVWLEVVPTPHVGRLRWTPSLERWELSLALHLSGPVADELRLHVDLHVGERCLASDSYSVHGNEVHRRIALADPGIDDYRNELLWSPEAPTLIEGDIRLVDRKGREIDRMRTYTALRSVHVDERRFLLNGRPYPMRLVLDQGYWPETGLTAPDDAALKRDVELGKAMGFNGVRKHQKLEDPRYLYWADRLGLLVWAEMPSAYRFTSDAIERVTREWVDAVQRDCSHPCVVAWVPFNESWGVPNLPQNPAERDFVAALYYLTKSLDPTRPVVGNDGWESVRTDIIGVHDYDADAARLGRRYHSDEILPRVIRHERPAGRALVLDAEPVWRHPVVLSEFGGVAMADDSGETWGYSESTSAADLAQRYAALLAAVRSSIVLAGFCYTQFADTYQEANGLLTADRRPKFPLELIAAATTGVPWTAPRELPSDPFVARDLK